MSASLRAEAIAKGDHWGEEDVEEAGGSEVDEEEEKGSGLRKRRRRRRNRRSGRGGRRRMGELRSDREEWEAAEEDLRREGAKYYNTDVTHRFIWWQTKGDIKRLADQVQRIQIRRMERDIFETDELVRILIRGEGLGDMGVAGRPGEGRPFPQGVTAMKATVAMLLGPAGVRWWSDLEQAVGHPAAGGQATTARSRSARPLGDRLGRRRLLRMSLRGRRGCRRTVRPIWLRGAGAMPTWRQGGAGARGWNMRCCVPVRVVEGMWW